MHSCSLTSPQILENMDLEENRERQARRAWALSAMDEEQRRRAGQQVILHTCDALAAKMHTCGAQKAGYGRATCASSTERLFTKDVAKHREARS